MPIISHLLLSLFAIGPTSGDSIRDTCDVLDSRTGTSAYCEPHSEGAPVFDGTVCCAEGACFAAPEGLCLTDEELLYCELGEQRADEQVDCYFEVPDYCDAFTCGEPPPGYTPLPEADVICCEFGVCVPYVTGSGTCEEVNLYTCGSLVSNPDGTVTCVDWE